MGGSEEPCGVCKIGTIWRGRDGCCPNQCPVCSERIMKEFQTKVNSGIKILSITYDLFGTLFKLDDSTSYRVWGCDWFDYSVDITEDDSENESENESEQDSERYSDSG